MGGRSAMLHRNLRRGG